MQNRININYYLKINKYDFRVKYLGKEHALHLKATLEDKYKVTTYWEGKLHIGIALKWDYEKVTVQLSTPGYLCAALNSFQHENPQNPKTRHTTLHNPYMEKIVRCY